MQFIFAKTEKILQLLTNFAHLNKFVYKFSNLTLKPCKQATV